MAAAEMACLSVVGAWIFVMYEGAGYARLEVNGEWVSATLIASRRAVVTALIGIGVISVCQIVSDRFHHPARNADAVEPSVIAKRKSWILAFLWLPWFLICSGVFTNQCLEMRQRARAHPMSGGLRQNLPSAVPPATDSAPAPARP